MDGPGSDGLRGLSERLGLAALGAVTLTAERAEVLADALAERGGLSRMEARRLVDDVVSRWRGETGRLGERAGASLEGLFRELGLVTRGELDELELRLAQLEHRLRLVEEPPAGADPRQRPRPV